MTSPQHGLQCSHPKSQTMGVWVTTSRVPSRVDLTAIDLTFPKSPTENNMLPSRHLSYFYWLVTLKSFQTHQDSEPAPGLILSSVQDGPMSKIPILQDSVWPICSVSHLILATVWHCGGQAIPKVRDPTFKIISLEKAENIVSVIRLKHGQP